MRNMGPFWGEACVCVLQYIVETRDCDNAPIALLSVPRVAPHIIGVCRLGNLLSIKASHSQMYHNGFMKCLLYNFT